MNLEAARTMAGRGRLYPSVILHGGDLAARREAAVELARTLLCEQPGDDPQATCVHCRRIEWPGAGDHFHPDFLVLERDLKTATSVEATKNFLRSAQVAPFEARGQVFAIASAESLSGEAANALLKSLEEPHLTAPRHFLLLTPSQFDLLPTLRSRSLSVYLGSGGRLESEALDQVSGDFSGALAAYAESGSVIELMAAAAALLEAGDFQDARADLPWSVAAAAVRGAIDDPAVTAGAGSISPKRCSTVRGCACAESPRSASSRGWSSSTWASLDVSSLRSAVRSPGWPAVAPVPAGLESDSTPGYHRSPSAGSPACPNPSPRSS